MARFFYEYTCAGLTRGGCHALLGMTLTGSGALSNVDDVRHIIQFHFNHVAVPRAIRYDPYRVRLIPNIAFIVFDFIIVKEFDEFFLI
jgi:hypothetical protein